MKKNSKKLLIILSVVIILLAILVILYFVKLEDRNLDNNKKNKLQGNTLEEEIEDLTNINNNNLENAKIENGEKVNTSTELNKKHGIYSDVGNKLINVEILDMKIYSKNDNSYCEFTIKNNDSVNSFSGDINLRFYNKKKKEVYEFIHHINNLSPNATRKEMFFDSQDFINIYGYKVIYFEDS